MIADVVVRQADRQTSSRSRVISATHWFAADTVARVVLALMALIAAILWFVSARIEVPDNIDTIVRRLQRIGFWNGWASVFSCIAALFGALDVFLTMIETIK
jgi:hypothetical protein